MEMRKIHLGNLSGYILQKLDFFNQLSDINILIFNVKDYMGIRNLLAGIQENIVSFRVIKHDSFIREIRNTEINKLGLCLHIFLLLIGRKISHRKNLMKVIVRLLIVLVCF